MKKQLHTYLLLALSAIAVQAATPGDGSLEGFVYPLNRAASASISFAADGTSALSIGDGGNTVVRTDLASGRVSETLLDLSHTRGDSKLEALSDYIVSPDGSKLLIYNGSTPIYRHSFWATWYVFDIKRNTLKPLSTEHPRQQAPTFSPDGRMVAFMADDNNIYLSKLDYGTEVAVTTDGCVNAVINGVPDWTYQEEFETYGSMAWAPDNSALSYLKYDESQVPMYSFALYQGACDPKDQYALYPGQFDYKYPVAGEKNSVVSIHSYDVETRKTKDITLPDATIEYIPRIHYGPTADVLIAATLNREQNRLELYSVNPRSTTSRSIYVDRSDKWITPECYTDLAFEHGSFVVNSSRTGFNHLYRYSYAGALMATLTSGQYDVTAYYGTAADGSYAYQSAAHGAINRVVTLVNRKGTATDLTPAEGWASATFAPGLAYYLLNYSTAQTPPVYTLVSTDKNRTLRTLQDNATYASRFASAPKKEFFTFTTADGVTLNGWMIKPADFDASRRYPAIIYQYSGPGSQEVTNRWSMDWAQYFATQGYVIACVDGRGTGARGRAFEQITYKNLGHYETIDQNALLSHLRSLSWINPEAVGIYGWSYGGYETLMAAQSGAPYAAAVAVAPVTSWRYYDTIYAERYMSTPQQNAAGYTASAPVDHTDGLSCPLLMISGTADDNVHMANTIEYISRLEQEGRWADMLLFPNMNHSINGCNTRALVYKRMLAFFDSHLKNK